MSVPRVQVQDKQGHLASCAHLETQGAPVPHCWEGHIHPSVEKGAGSPGMGLSVVAKLAGWLLERSRHRAATQRKNKSPSCQTRLVPGWGS